MWRILIVATLVGLGLGVARAWWDVGSFDTAAPLRAFDFPVGDEPDYWQVPDGRRAKAKFDSLRFDFGKLEVGHTMRHVFRVTNEGDFPLMLAERESSCVCTAAELSERPIPPGETADVTLEWNAPADARPGEPYRQWAMIDTNDSDQASVTLVVEGKLAAAVAAESPVLAFGTVAGSQTKVLSTRVLSYRAAGDPAAAIAGGFSIAATEFDDPATAEFFDVRTEPLMANELGEPGATAGVRLSVTLKPGLPAGPFHQTIRLRSNLADATPIAVSLVGEIGPDAFVSGPGYSRRTSTLNLGRVDAGRGTAGKGVERRLTLVVFSPADAAIAPRVVESTPAGLQAEIGPELSERDGALHWPLTVRFGLPDAEAVPAVPGSADATEKTGRIVLETGHGTVKRIEMTVKFSVAAASAKDARPQPNGD